MHTRPVRRSYIQSLESRKLLAGDGLASGGTGDVNVCLAFGDPHAQPTRIVEIARSFASPVATTELPPLLKTAGKTEATGSDVEPVIKEPNGSDDTPDAVTEAAKKEESDSESSPKTQETEPAEAAKTGEANGSANSVELPPQAVLTEETGDNESAAENDIAPQVAQIEFDGEQRSILNEFTIVFDAAVEVDSAQGDLLRVVNRETQQEVNLDVTVEMVIGATRIHVRIASGPSVETTASAPSLIDGNYELTINASRVSIGGHFLDGDGNGTGGDDYTFGEQASDGFFRLFGDQDGDRDVDDIDYEEFVDALLSTASNGNFDERFDSDNDGDVDGKDFGQYRNRHNTTLEFA